MSLYALDTDILTLLRHQHPLVSLRANAVAEEDLAITVISVEEQLTGWYGAVRQARGPRELAEAYDRLAKSVRFLARLPILPFSEAAIRRFEQLKRQKLNVGANDLKVAAIALESGAIVVTQNVRDFRRVNGLTYENWLNDLAIVLPSRSSYA